MTDIQNFSGYYRFLSNFYRNPVTLGSVIYPTAEHAYQMHKPKFESDRLEVSFARTPGEAKRLANLCVPVNDWHEIKLAIMEKVLRAKFDEPNARALLLSTRGRNLIEGNTWGDIYWGVCNGAGHNHLGKLLMKIRDNA